MCACLYLGTDTCHSGSTHYSWYSAQGSLLGSSMEPYVMSQRLDSRSATCKRRSLPTINSGPNDNFLMLYFPSYFFQLEYLKYLKCFLSLTTMETFFCHGQTFISLSQISASMCHLVFPHWEVWMSALLDSKMPIRSNQCPFYSSLNKKNCQQLFYNTKIKSLHVRVLYSIVHSTYFCSYYPLNLVFLFP